jgi:hypothetical protein
MQVIRCFFILLEFLRICQFIITRLSADHFALILTNGVLGLYGSVFLFEGDGFGGVVELQVFQGVQYVLGLEGGFQFALQSQRFCRGRRLVY